MASAIARSVASPRTIEEDAERELEQAKHRRAWGSALERMLRGEHRAMVEVLDQLPARTASDGRGAPARRPRRGHGRGRGQRSVIDFPMGTAFWDTFTIEQCRRVVGALKTMGYAYDGRDGWVGDRVPAYRDLAQALADVGIEPRRIRSWPNSSDIAGLFVGARPAPEELLAAGSAYDVNDVRELVGGRAEELQDLWLDWDAVRPALLEEHLTAG